MFIHDSMATRASLQRRQALGLLNGNVSAHPVAPPRRIGSEFGHEKLRREGQGRVLGKHSIDFLDDAQAPKAVQYMETHDKRLGIEHWLEDGVVDGGLSCSAQDDDTAVLGQLTTNGRDLSLCDSVQEALVTREFDQGQEYRHQDERFAEVDKGYFESNQRLLYPQAGKSDYPLRVSVNPEASGATAFSSSAAATALRLRLRVALFKVQTNQTAIPISHLQLPETSPQPLSVFPPSLVRVSAERNVHDCYHDFFYGDDKLTAPPSSPPPPPLTVTGTLLDELPFLVPARLSSPSVKFGEPLEFGSSTIFRRRVSPRNH